MVKNAYISFEFFFCPFKLHAVFLGAIASPAMQV